MSERRRDCPFCGRIILQNDETRTLAHALPVCREFEALSTAGGRGMKAVGITTRTPLELELLEQVPKKGPPPEAS